MAAVDILCRHCLQVLRKISESLDQYIPDRICTRNVPNTKNECCLRIHNVRGISSLISSKFPVLQGVIPYFFLYIVSSFFIQDILFGRMHVMNKNQNR